jgi:hypothetical protein
MFPALLRKFAEERGNTRKVSLHEPAVDGFGEEKAVRDCASITTEKA